MIITSNKQTLFRVKDKIFALFESLLTKNRQTLDCSAAFIAVSNDKSLRDGSRFPYFSETYEILYADERGASAFGFG
ncbi:hypothetical protein J2S13_002541 [Oikeobacillus pervagus]|uniref:Uncharacterized protein n=1 Tax=Oikeobacillus pervagus TaxID=1325931 RepID=A0AAJ1T0Q5_9BACI|nr:hypothetical protein [Oikeobacillus pervagus]